MRKDMLAFVLAASSVGASVPCLAADDSAAEVPKPVSPEEIEALKRRIESERRSQAELLFDDHTESGDLNNRLDFRRYGFKVALRRDGTALLASVTRTPYATIQDLLTATATGVTIGAERRLQDSIESRVELGLTHFDGGATTLGGEAAVTVHPSEKLRYSAGLARTRVEESFLTAVGIRPVAGPFAGQRVGPVMENRLEASGSYRLPAQLDVYGEAAVGARTGSNVESNAFRRAGAGVGYNAIVGSEDRALSLLRLSVSVYYFGFDKDLFGYGGASLLDASYQPVPVPALGSDGLPTVAEPGVPGVGGYFSPSRFLSRLARVDLRGRPRPRLDYSVAFFLGRQSYTGIAPRLAAGASAEVVLRSGERVSLPVSWAWDNVGPYRQQTLQARLRAKF